MKILPGKRAVVGLLAVAAVMLIPLAGMADTVFFDLNAPNTDMSAYSGTFASITMDGGGVAGDNNTDFITFTVVGLQGTRISDGARVQYLFAGAKDMFGINYVTPNNVTGYRDVNGSRAAMSGFDPIPSSYVVSSGKNVDGFGTFDSVIEDGQFKDAVSSFTFTTTQKYDSASQLLAYLQETYNPGYFAAAHIYAAPIVSIDGVDTVLKSNGAFATGYVADGNQRVVVPLPPSVLLLGSGLLGVGLLGWRRKKV
jgi:hypothetical protein